MYVLLNKEMCVNDFEMKGDGKCCKEETLIF